MKIVAIGLSAVALVIATPAVAREKKPPATTDLTPVSAEDILPTDFRGSITYRGIYKGKASAPSKMTTDWGRKLEASIGVHMVPMAGDFAITIEFNGTRISGSTQTTSGLNGDHATLDPGKFIGTRQGGTCHLMWTDGTETNDYCGRSEYRSRVDDTAENGQKTDMTVLAPADAVVDFVERDKQLAILNQQRAADAVKYAAVRAKNDRIANAQGPIAARMDAIAEIDSRSWMAWGYKPGSMSNVQKTAIQDARNFSATGNFIYSDGRPGSVMAQVRGGAFSCLQFGNESACRTIGHPPSHDLAGVLLGAFVGGMAGGSGSSGSSGGYSEEAYRDNQRDIERQAHVGDTSPPPPPPVTPIGGNSGLNGADHSCCE